MRIGVFGGSFDPVHVEHVRLVESALRDLSLDSLFVMPAHAPPHKVGKTLSSDEARLQACRLAFAYLPKVEVREDEIARGGTSYTYLTCERLREAYPNDEIFWLVGTDMLRDFPTWKHPEKILSYVTLAVCARNEKSAWVEEEQAVFFRRFGKKFVRISYEGQDVSSTKIRVFAGAGMRLTEFLPPSVAAYVEEEGLYAVAGAKEALALQKPSRAAHSIRVAELAAARALTLKIPEKKAIEAALFHDCAKNLSADSPYLRGFSLPTEWGEVPAAVAHQFAGAYVAENTFGVKDEEVLAAIRFHTSGRANMGELEKLIFLADMLEAERNYDGVEAMRALFWQGDSLDECLKKALYETLLFIKKKGEAAYPLTQIAYEFYAKL